jgi:16S rRNA (guanine1207-N2)-methyltransferase
LGWPGNQPDLLVEEVNGVELRFWTRAGVFSRKRLDPGTRLLLENLDLTGATLIADLGCGVGAAGIFCARAAPGASVHLLDDHLRAIELARKNVALNGLSNAEVHLSDLFSAVGAARYSHVVSNPPAQLGNEFLQELVDESLAHLTGEGQLWLVLLQHLKPVFERFLDRARASHTLVARGRQHLVLKAWTAFQ